jgi:hypothetical protein
MRLRNLFIQNGGEPRPDGGRAEARIAMLPTHDLAAWVETSLYSIGRNLSDYSRDPALRQDHLNEAVASAEVLLKLLTELRDRG